MFRKGTIVIFNKSLFVIVEKILENGHVRFCWNGNTGSYDSMKPGKLFEKAVKIIY